MTDARAEGGERASDHEAKPHCVVRRDAASCSSLTTALVRTNGESERRAALRLLSVIDHETNRVVTSQLSGGDSVTAMQRYALVFT